MLWNALCFQDNTILLQLKVSVLVLPSLSFLGCVIADMLWSEEVRRKGEIEGGGGSTEVGRRKKGEGGKEWGREGRRKNCHSLLTQYCHHNEKHTSNVVYVIYNTCIDR